MGVVPGVAKTLVETSSGRFIKDMQPILSHGSHVLCLHPKLIS